MRVAVFSERLNRSECVGCSRYFYTLAFTYEFEHDEDTVFFVYTTPYTYSELNSDISSFEKDSSVTRNTLCRMLDGNKCEYLRVTAKDHPDVRAATS